MLTTRQPAEPFAIVREAARDLREVEEGVAYGTPALRVKGKLFARLREDGETLALKMDFTNREALLRDEPGLFYLTDHYRNYEWVLLRLSKVSKTRLRQELKDAWQRVAPRGARDTDRRYR